MKDWGGEEGGNKQTDCEESKKEKHYLGDVRWRFSTGTDGKAMP